MDAFKPCAHVGVTIHHDALNNTCNVLQDLDHMLHIAQENIKVTQVYVIFYANHN